MPEKDTYILFEIHSRLASAQLRAGSATLGSELGLDSRLGTRAWLIADGFVAH